MMKRSICFLALLFGLTACQKEETLPVEEPVSAVPEEPTLIEGHIRVKLTEAAVAKLNVIQTRSGISTGITTLDKAVATNRVYRMEPTFQVGGKFEARQRRAGLHLWYDVWFDEGIPTRSVAGELNGNAEIEYVETIYEARLLPHVSFPNSLMQALQPLMLLSTRGAQPADEPETPPFNDPRLSEQWHYHNTGEAGNGLSGAIAGADIDLYRAWEVETGSPDVIVAVMDGGIQYNHPDLAANMWINQAEQSGTTGVDDDNNGYIDDIYGVNFVTRTQVGNLYDNVAITQHSHGTHVAGTISAVNGNRTGVCGIAGGSGKGDGVRLMSCQMFHMDGTTEKSGASPDMYRYAADNGAMISQNSWTTPSLQGKEDAFLNGAIRAGIDYFIDNAGTDVNGNQIGPMKGGVVLFATANENTDVKSFPAAYERNFRVAAMGANFKKASYSNYGTWADITAPGGEQRNGNEFAILSTEIDGGYSWKQGTSMACPHASGCTALLLSKYQGPGYTPDQLVSLLLNTAGNIDQYNPQYVGLMGKGYIQIGEALVPPAINPPAVPELQLIAAYDSWAIVEWTIGQAEDGNLNRYDLYWGQESITEGNLSAVSTKSYDVKFRQPGEVIRDTVRNLTVNDTWYFTLRSSDRWGQYSGLAEAREVLLVPNNAPVLKAQWAGEMIFSEGSEYSLSVTFSDKENHTVTAELQPAIDWVKTEVGAGTIRFTLQVPYGAAGIYSRTFVVRDEYGAVSSLPVRIEVQHRNVAPSVTAGIPDVVLNAGAGVYTLPLDSHFTDPAGRKLVYGLEWDERNANIAFVQRKDNKLLITPQGNGTIYVTVRAVNPDGMEASAGFSVTVNRVVGDWDVSQTGDKVTIYLAQALQGTTTLRLYNVAGREVRSISAYVGDTGYVLDLSDLSAGVYTLVLKAGNEELRKNLIKK